MRGPNPASPSRHRFSTACRQRLEGQVMIPASFDYSSPKTLSEAISLLQQHGADAKILSGGQSLISLMKLRMAAPKHVVRHQWHRRTLLRQGGRRIPHHRGADARGRRRRIEVGPRSISSARRHRGSDRRSSGPQPGYGGGESRACRSGQRPSGHHAGLCRLGRGNRAEWRAHGRHFRFFTGIFTTTLQPDEILTEIRVPVPQTRVPVSQSGEKVGRLSGGSRGLIDHARRRQRGRR